MTNRYGYQHRKLRDQIKTQVDAGQTHCWRCLKRIDPSQPWDLGHDDDNPTIYRGPEHVACNRNLRAQPQTLVDTSRQW